MASDAGVGRDDGSLHDRRSIHPAVYALVALLAFLPALASPILVYAGAHHSGRGVRLGGTLIHTTLGVLLSSFIVWA